MDIESLGKIVKFLDEEFEEQEFGIDIPLEKDIHNSLQEKLWELDRSTKFTKEDIFTIQMNNITFTLRTRSY
tara:strand:- start:645 stop:860 length:216 start_codon:yes stop_codon:yes gene_type:complete